MGAGQQLASKPKVGRSIAISGLERPFFLPGSVWTPTVNDSLSLECHPLVVQKMVRLEAQPT